MNKTCEQCKKGFTVTDDDLAFLKKISPEFGGKKFEIPPPTLCSDCRWQRRIVFRNERTLYKRKCDLTGKMMVSMYPEGTSFPVYYISDWYSDKWDPKEYGQGYDSSRPFFEQLKELIYKVPRYNAFVDPMMDVNSEYTNCAGYSRNCYWIFEADRNENCYYSRALGDCRECCDCLRAYESELCYECVDISKCYHSFYCQDCNNSSDCYFSSNLRGCKYCFGCHGLSRKQYFIYNKQVTPEEWKSHIESLNLDETKIEEFKKRSEEIKSAIPRRFAQIIHCEKSIGDHLLNCKNANVCFDSNKLEDCRYCFEVPNDAKDCMDYSSFGLATSRVYETNSSGYRANNLLFCVDCFEYISNLYYCYGCIHNIKNCFGCVGMQKSEYCVLNKQYTKEEYEKLVSQIIEDMIKNGEWGEFLPASLSPYGYNETLANEYFPLSKDEAIKLGANWQDKEPSRPEADSIYEPLGNISYYKNSEEEREKLSRGVLKCKISGKLYKIILQELAYYIRQNVPIPTKHFDERHKERLALRNKARLYHRQCMCDESGHNHEGKCKVEFETSYAPERQEKIYCEDCYQKSVI